jgi:plastocyanin
VDVQNLFDEDGIDRRGFLKCMAWAGTGMLFTVSGGVVRSRPLWKLLGSDAEAEAASFSFVQISDSHVGFSKEANKDVVGTLKAAVDRINSGPAPDLLIHTGDLSHLSKPQEFDTLDQILTGVRTTARFFVPGEHDVLEDGGKAFRERYTKKAKGDGWYSFDHKGVHFIGLVNVLNLKAGGFGNLGQAQLEWLRDDVRTLRSSTPIIVFAHVPLWTVYPEWGWGTDDGAQALEILRRFGSVTVLNGHIHQAMQKIEGNVTFHTAASTAFPQPRPGSAPSPGPMTVPADQLRTLLGVTSVQYREGTEHLAVVDSSLADPVKDQTVNIDNFRFSPTPLSIARGASVTWTNRDDIPHNVVEKDGRFKSKVLDTNDSFSHTFAQTGDYTYFCSLHPHMVGKVIVS